MFEDYGENIYNILSNVVNLNFKAQIKNSGIAFKRFFKIIDLESNKEFFQLTINDENILFMNQQDFLKEFISFLEKSIEDLETQFDLLKEESKGRFIDKNAIFMENETIGLYSNKQSKLLDKMRKLLTK